jgi:NADH dehydrogenase FAD-containing subunit
MMLNNKSTLFPGQPRAAEKINRELAAKSIKLINNCEVSEVTKEGVYCKFTEPKESEERQFIKGNVVLWCTGAESHVIRCFLI